MSKPLLVVLVLGAGLVITLVSLFYVGNSYFMLCDAILTPTTRAFSAPGAVETDSVRGFPFMYLTTAQDICAEHQDDISWGISDIGVGSFLLDILVWSFVSWVVFMGVLTVSRKKLRGTWINNKSRNRSAKTLPVIATAVLLGLVATVVSYAVPRMGTPYACADQMPVSEPYNRSERGIPFVYLQQSLEGSPFCDFVEQSTGKPINRDHIFEVLPFVADIVFWTLASGGLMCAGMRIRQHE